MEVEKVKFKIRGYVVSVTNPEVDIARKRSNTEEKRMTSLRTIGVDLVAGVPSDEPVNRCGLSANIISISICCRVPYHLMKRIVCFLHRMNFTHLPP